MQPLISVPAKKPFCEAGKKSGLKLKKTKKAAITHAASAKISRIALELKKVFFLKENFCIKKTLCLGKNTIACAVAGGTAVAVSRVFRPVCNKSLPAEAAGTGLRITRIFGALRCSSALGCRAANVYVCPADCRPVKVSPDENIQILGIACIS